MASKTIILGAVYPKAESFLSDYLESWTNQTDRNFTLYLLNDQFENLKNWVEGFGPSVQILNVEGTPGEIRSQGMAWSLEQGAGIIIFSDVDDIFMNNRVEKIRHGLAEGADIIVNELIPFDDRGNYGSGLLESRIKDGDVIEAGDVADCNFLGMSNTAIRAAALDGGPVVIPPEIKAFDWAFFSTLLARGSKALFTKGTATFYRQHNDNLAKLNRLTEDDIILGVEVKLNHYRYMSSISNRFPPLYHKYRDLRRLIDEDQAFRRRYCRRVLEEMKEGMFWWEHIRDREELQI